jgi:hypothetical protein
MRQLLDGDDLTGDDDSVVHVVVVAGLGPCGPTVLSGWNDEVLQSVPAWLDGLQFHSACAAGMVGAVVVDVDSERRRGERQQSCDNHRGGDDSVLHVVPVYGSGVWDGGGSVPDDSGDVQ